MAVLGGEYPIRWFRSTLIGVSEQGSTLAPGYGTEAFKLTGCRDAVDVARHLLPYPARATGIRTVNVAASSVRRSATPRPFIARCRTARPP